MHEWYLVILAFYSFPMSLQLWNKIWSQSHCLSRRKEPELERLYFELLWITPERPYSKTPLTSKRKASNIRSSCWQLLVRTGFLKKNEIVSRKTPLLESLLNSMLWVWHCKFSKRGLHHGNSKKSQLLFCRKVI